MDPHTYRMFVPLTNARAAAIQKNQQTPLERIDEALYLRRKFVNAMLLTGYREVNTLPGHADAMQQTYIRERRHSLGALLEQTASQADIQLLNTRPQGDFWILRMEFRRRNLAREIHPAPDTSSHANISAPAQHSPLSIPSELSWTAVRSDSRGDCGFLDSQTILCQIFSLPRPDTVDRQKRIQEAQEAGSLLVKMLLQRFLISGCGKLDFTILKNDKTKNVSQKFRRYSDSLKYRLDREQFLKEQQRVALYRIGQKNLFQKFHDVCFDKAK